MTEKKRYYIVAIVLSAFFITFLHYTTFETIHAMHDIYRQLYFIPLLMGALVFGLRGAVLTYVFVSILYLPYMVGSWTGQSFFDAKRVLFLLFAALFTFIAGFLVDRERRSKKEMEKAQYLAGIGQAASAIVHDLKNPLLTVQGFARRIAEGKGDPLPASQAILESAGVMQNIITDVLDFAKPIQLERREEDLSATINTACDICTSKAKEKGVALLVNVPDEPLTALFDRSLIQRALVNLMGNAIEASERGQEVAIGATREPDVVRIIIRDNGAGMDRETFENLFVPFFTRKSAGTGLGMPIAKKIIDEHGGTIQVESHTGKGTTVRISLPAR